MTTKMSSAPPKTPRAGVCPTCAAAVGERCIERRVDIGWAPWYVRADGYHDARWLAVGLEPPENNPIGGKL